MNMKEPNRSINDESGGEKMSDTILEMDEILTCYVIDEGDSLSGFYSGGFQCLEKSEVDILLLFSLEKVYECIGAVASMPRTSNRHLSSTITRF